MAFQKGRSGNPSGRKKGSQDWRGKLRSQLEGATPEIIEALLDKARDGDLQAAKIIIDRVLPPLKAQSLPVTLQVNAQDEAGRAQAVFSAILNGDITPDIGGDILAALATVLKVRETSEIIKRVEELERALKERGAA